MSEKTITISFANINLRSILIKIIPIFLIGIALFAIIWGLYKRLASEQAFNTFVYPFEQDFQEFDIYRWFPQDGIGHWSLVNNALVQTDQEAESASIFVSHWLVEGQPYLISVQIDLSEGGRSAGINFNAEYPEIYTHHHRAVVTLSDGLFELSTGLVTEMDGYKEQVRVPLGSLEQPFRLDVLAGAEVYAVQINGQTLIENRPLFYHDGLVGLVASGSSVIFDDIKLAEIENNIFEINLREVETLPHEIPEQVVGNMIYTSNFAGGSKSNGWVPFSGDWELVDGYLTQQDPTGYDFGIGYENSKFESFILQTTFTHQEGIGAGVLFNMPTPYQTNGAHMVRYSESGKGVFWGYYDANGNFTGQGHAITPTKDDTPHTIKIMSGDDIYAIFVDNQQVATNIPLINNSGYIGLITSRSTAAFGLVDISGLLYDLWAEVDSEYGSTLVTPPLTVDAVNWSSPLQVNATLFDEGFHSDALNSSWIPINGHWRVKDNLLVQSDQGGYDFGIGFDGEIFQDYRYDVPITHIGGVGAGLLFNMPSPNSLQWASIVRYSDTTDKLMWGYYDEAGKFKGQGSATVPAPGLGQHIISVVSKETYYDVWLDGERLGTDIPLARKRGYIGLVTSRSAGEFGPLTISSSNKTLGDNLSLLGNMYIISGDWTQDGLDIRQNNTDFKDSILSIGVFAGVYSLETTITLPKKTELDEAGGGIIFHMPAQDDYANAHLVRLSGGGRGVFWGYFDEDKGFVGQGSKSFTKDTDEDDLEKAANVFLIKIIVQNDTYDLLINGEKIVEGAKLVNKEGFIGLLTYRGPVTFKNINLMVGGLQ